MRVPFYRKSKDPVKIPENAKMGGGGGGRKKSNPLSWGFGALTTKHKQSVHKDLRVKGFDFLTPPPLKFRFPWSLKGIPALPIESYFHEYFQMFSDTFIF